MLVRTWTEGNLCALAVGMQSAAATLENSMGSHQKLKTAAHGPHRHHPQGTGTGSQGDVGTSVLTAASLTVAEVWEPPQALRRGEWMKATRAVRGTERAGGGVSGFTEVSTKQ